MEFKKLAELETYIQEKGENVPDVPEVETLDTSFERRSYLLEIAQLKERLRWWKETESDLYDFSYFCEDRNSLIHNSERALKRYVEEGESPLKGNEEDWRWSSSFIDRLFKCNVKHCNEEE